MAISDRISQCIEHLDQGDHENAFIQLSIAIDGTAKKQYVGLGSTKRCKKFLRDNLPFVLWSLTNGTTTKVKDFTFEFQSSGSPSGPTKFEDVVYSALRCNLLHEASLPDNIEFTSQSAIMMKDGRLHFPTALIGALAFAVISSPANANEPAPLGQSFTFGTKTFDISELWADRAAVKEAIRAGFQYDVEKMLKAHN
jgi:hypothetical protein